MTEKEEKASGAAIKRVEGEVDIDALVVKRSNPRPASELKGEGIADLKASIDEIGLLHRPIVRPISGGRYEIEAGARRVAACRELGWKTVPCCDLGHDEGDALVTRFAENELRSDVDPIQASDLIVAMLKQPNWTLSTVADKLGKSVSWVARRHNLRTIAPSLRAEVAEWPIDWLEEFALLAPEAQEDFAFEGTGKSRRISWRMGRIDSLKGLREALGGTCGSSRPRRGT